MTEPVSFEQAMTAFIPVDILDKPHWTFHGCLQRLQSAAIKGAVSLDYKGKMDLESALSRVECRVSWADRFDKGAAR